MVEEGVLPKVEECVVLASQKERQIKGHCRSEHGSFGELKDPDYCCRLKSLEVFKNHVCVYTHLYIRAHSRWRSKWKVMAL